MSSKPFEVVLLGGTFDRLHEGHKKLFEMAALLGKKVAIGITGSVLIGEKRLATMIQPIGKRIEHLMAYWKVAHADVPLELTHISDVYGGALEVGSGAIIISDESKVFTNCLDINTARRNKELEPLIIIIVPRVLDEGGMVISSTRIREKEC